MCKSVMICLAIVAAVLVFAVQGQTPPATPAQCSSVVSSLGFNNTNLMGTWIEVARNPAANVSCIKINVDLWNNTNLLVNISHSSSLQSLYMDVNEKANITLATDVAASTAGYNVTFTKNGQSETPVYIKLLSTVDSDKYLLGCAYTDANNNATSYGFILSRGGYTAAGIEAANNNASLYYSNFLNGTYSNVTQLGCYASSASQTLPLLTGFLAVAMALIFKA
ncbi:uncharacterized protein LOC117585499 [Drosophila guanche]|uniref:Lipocalin/cytosolic fatty-acid binding domain-containing protein n=1 Tax=Drosophila guanche TaxID=7266 RepID=A0A3B0KEA7_DROGU|nr:uncharacterized protein LOC117585499 [Drosophila guanche]SPP83371.1 Hypothetical predicted protein [Drosophila guanche]